MKHDFTEDKSCAKYLIISYFLRYRYRNNWRMDIYGYQAVHKKELKENGSKKKMQYWHSEAFKKKGKKVHSMEDIR